MRTGSEGVQEVHILIVADFEALHAEGADRHLMLWRGVFTIFRQTGPGVTAIARLTFADCLSDFIDARPHREGAAFDENGFTGCCANRINGT